MTRHGLCRCLGHLLAMARGARQADEVARYPGRGTTIPTACRLVCTYHLSRLDDCCPADRQPCANKVHYIHGTEPPPPWSLRSRRGCAAFQDTEEGRQAEGRRIFSSCTNGWGQTDDTAAACCWPAAEQEGRRPRGVWIERRWLFGNDLCVRSQAMHSTVTLLGVREATMTGLQGGTLPRS